MNGGAKPPLFLFIYKLTFKNICDIIKEKGVFINERRCNGNII